MSTIVANPTLPKAKRVHPLRTPAVKSLMDDCVHCGLCLPKCPTFNDLGNENDSPRGRIRLMVGLAERVIRPTPTVVRHLDQCLDCRACETACPSGVAYGELLEAARRDLRDEPRESGGPLVSRLVEHLIYGVLPDVRRFRRALRWARFTHDIGLSAFLRESGLTAVLGRLGQMEAMLPALPAHPPDDVPALSPARTPRRARVAMFLGCAGEVLFPDTNRATVRVLQRNGCDVLCPEQQACCGAIHQHGGRTEAAADLLRRNIDAFEQMAREHGAFDAVVVNAAGCGAMLKQAGAALADDPAYAARAADFASRIRDISEFLTALSMTPPHGRLKLRVAYHDPCHLCHAQGVRAQPRQMLRAIRGLELLNLYESEVCCGAAGSYGITQPELSGRLARRKLAAVQRLPAVDAVATGNVGCILQLLQHSRAAGRPLSVRHPIDLLDEAYRSGDYA